MAQRHKDALGIQQGACNPSGIAHSIVAACQEMRAEANFKGTDQIKADPAIRLMVHQLAFICNVPMLDHDPNEYRKAADACEKAAV